MKTRIYDKNIDIDNNKVKQFWNKRAETTFGNKAVLLGDDLNAEDLRNNKEKNILSSNLANKKYKILDIGCGSGRWVNNLYDFIDEYSGIDFCENFIDSADKIFSNDKNIQFYKMSASNLNKSKLLPKYDLIIITGVLMYINDNELQNVFNDVASLLDNDGLFYLQESISTINERLTLKDFLSNELNTNYNAIYRKPIDYEKYLNFGKIIEKNLLLDKSTGAREETNAQYWILRKD